MDNENKTTYPSFPSLPQTPTSIPSSTNWFKIPLLIVALLIIITGSVIAGIQIGKSQVPKQQLIKIQPSNLPTQIVVSPTTLPVSPLPQTTLPTSSIIINPTINPTTNWKTVNNQYWTFRIPQNWNYNRCLEVEWISAGPEIPKDTITEKDKCEGGGYSTLTVVRNFGKFSIPISIPQDTSDPNKYFLTVVNKKIIKINNETAISQSEYSYPFGPNKKVESIAVYIQQSNYTDSIIVSDRTPEDPNTSNFSDTKNTFDLILSSFEFNN